MNNFTIDNYESLKKINNFMGDPADLITENKTIVGAINEISGGGGSVSTIEFTITNSSTKTMKVTGSFEKNGSFSGNQISISSGTSKTVKTAATDDADWETNDILYITSSSSNPTGKKVAITKSEGAASESITQNDIQNVAGSIPKIYLQISRIQAECVLTISYVNE